MDYLMTTSVIGVEGNAALEPRLWRAEDLEQRVLGNARYLWERFVRENRLALDEHAEQLRGLAKLSALIASFGIIAFIQFDFDPTEHNLVLLLMFAITNTATVSLNICCMATCSLMLACTYRMYTNLLTDDHEAIYMLKCREYARRYGDGNHCPPGVGSDFQSLWTFHFRSEWHRTLFMFSTGLVMFLATIACAAFIHFNGSTAAAVCLTIPLGLGLMYFLFAHAKWLRHLTTVNAFEDMIVEVGGELEPMGLPFDWHRPTRVYGKDSSLVREASSARLFLRPAEFPSSADPLLHEQAVWRAQDREQDALSNTRVLWLRHISSVLTDAEERSEQLRSFAFLSGIMAGFGMAALLQLTFDPDTVNRALQIGFAITVALTGSFSICCMAMCSLILLSILKVGPKLTSAEEEATFVSECRTFALKYEPGNRPPASRRSFRRHWSVCHGEYVRAFSFFMIGLFASLAQLVFGGFIKYMPIWRVALAVAIITCSSILYLFFMSFRMVRYLIRSQKRAEAEKVSYVPAGLPFDWHSPPRPIAKVKAAAIHVAAEPMTAMQLVRKSIVYLGKRGLRLDLDDAEETSESSSPRAGFV